MDYWRACEARPSPKQDSREATPPFPVSIRSCAVERRWPTWAVQRESPALASVFTPMPTRAFEARLEARRRASLVLRLDSPDRKRTRGGSTKCHETEEERDSGSVSSPSPPSLR